MYDAVLFDLDGTLTESGPGITNSVAYALRRFGIDVPDPSVLRPFVGPPLVDSFRRFYGFTPDQARTAVEYYREYYRDRGIFENSVYPGVPALLEGLRAAGRRVLLATSKPEPFARQILVHYGLDGFFDTIAGAAMDESRTNKAEVIAYALDLGRIGPGDRAVMVGDRAHDVLGARENGLDVIGVLYGYGSRAELEEAGAAHIAATAADVLPLIL